MNITPSLIYWITMLDSIIAVSVIASILLFVALIVYCFLYIGFRYIEDEEEKASCLSKQIKHILSVLAISTVTSVFVPSSKEVAAMIVIPRVANSESVKDIGDGIVTLAKDWIEELKPSAKKDK